MPPDQNCKQSWVTNLSHYRHWIILSSFLRQSCHGYKQQHNLKSRDYPSVKDNMGKKFVASFVNTNFNFYPSSNCALKLASFKIDIYVRKNVLEHSRRGKRCMSLIGLNLLSLYLMNFKFWFSPLPRMSTIFNIILIICVMTSPIQIIIM